MHILYLSTIRILIVSSILLYCPFGQAQTLTRTFIQQDKETTVDVDNFRIGLERGSGQQTLFLSGRIRVQTPDVVIVFENLIDEIESGLWTNYGAMRITCYGTFNLDSISSSYFRPVTLLDPTNLTPQELNFTLHFGDPNSEKNRTTISSFLNLMETQFGIPTEATTFIGTIINTDYDPALDLINRLEHLETISTQTVKQTLDDFSDRFPDVIHYGKVALGAITLISEQLSGQTHRIESDTTTLASIGIILSTYVEESGYSSTSGSGENEVYNSKKLVHALRAEFMWHHHPEYEVMSKEWMESITLHALKGEKFTKPFLLDLAQVRLLDISASPFPLQSEHKEHSLSVSTKTILNHLKLYGNLKREKMNLIQKDEK